MSNQAQIANGDTKALGELAEVASVIAGQPPATVVLRDGTTVQVHKCKPRNIGTVLRFLIYIMEQGGITSLGQAPKAFERPLTVLNLIANSSVPLFETCAELCSLGYEDLLDLDLDEAVTIVMKVIEVNKSFFMQSVLPLLQSALPGVLGSQSMEVEQPA